MGHSHSEEGEKILDKEFPVLDKGFVRLVDYMGNDARIVQAARVSYGAGTKSYRQDAGLIDYLLRNEHTSPFEQVVFTFHVKLPIFVARQWVRHRTARLNEISARYSVMKDDFYVPALEDIAVQSSDNKQGRSSEAVDPQLAQQLADSIEKLSADAFAGYSQLLEHDLAREISRAVLPVNTYTEWYWQIDLHNLFRFLRLRLDPHAQKEIRLYAQAMLALVEPICPMATASFREHMLGGIKFSASEEAALKNALSGAFGDNAGTAIREAARAAGLEGKKLERFLAKLGLNGVD